MVTAFRDPPRSRWSMAFGAAFALHAALAVVGYRLAREAGSTLSERAQSVETEIELFDPLAETMGNEATGSAPTDELGAPVGSTQNALSSLTRSRAERRSTESTGPLDGSHDERHRDGEAPQNKAQDGYALDPTSGAAAGASSEAHAADGPVVQLGIGAGEWSRWVDPRAAPKETAPERNAFRTPPVSSTGGLAEALEARDQKLGLGPAGAVLSAVHEVGYSDIAPALGTATFSITVLRSGAIDVKLTGSSSETAQWAKVGESIAAAIRRKPPRIADTRVGVRLGIEVIAEERWPNGQATRSVESPKIVGEGLKFEPTETAIQELLERNPAAVPDPYEPADKPKLQANFRSPGVFVQGRGKVCSYRVGLSLTPISGGCDPANIGQPARRVVSTRIVSQTML